MADSRPLFLGPRLKRLRRELGLTQSAMAQDLRISPSYIALLERNQRPFTADLLLRLAKSYRFDLNEFAGDDAEAYQQRLTKVLRDPLFADIVADRIGVELAMLPTARVASESWNTHGTIIEARLDRGRGHGPGATRRVADARSCARVGDSLARRSEAASIAPRSATEVGYRRRHLR